ncbi:MULTISPECIES: ubiquinone biosynthesis regulatory protein kinase UbiB [unclassified Oleiphilus]|uniref:ubiquinone biosynthesis regulatory protein kinase UbiB n=3 Tax=Oleiphilus TaxID=141450 RepID=UPI0007C24815|nr:MULTISPECIES: ubiquinone biosynthesis regulatory protein kinase UbiB [unclassified Oleiphilus]KZZ37419.1 ubiquinone biosynthesis regulatory protein kinase UbiB [Oleiphilus sp. HI0117]KZZ55637.1 ubiquinone biosynthesis regulatory protein kinase UbiB [Oleiphilus sp. HI0123]
MSKLLLLTKLRRIFVILWVISRYRLDEFIPLAQLPLSARLLLILAPWHFFPKPKMSRGERTRLALETLGPIFIKFGQILSTRRDLLPDDIADHLKNLQDQVTPFSGAISKALIEKGLGKKVGEVFQEFDDEPLATASIAQVHSATLHSGKEVVVKVIRPGIERTIDQDIAVMLFFALVLENYWVDGKRLHPVQVVRDYEKTIYDELDLQREAANASQIRRNFLDSELIYIPEIHWDYTNQHVLVMERVYGIPVADVDALRTAGVNLKALAERGVEIFFTQVFRDSFFHADMHPGNIFVSSKNPHNPQYIAIDFGIVGTLTPEDQNYLARNLLAFFKRDYKMVAELHISSGWVPEDTRADEFESAIRTVCEPIFERPLKDISFGQFLLRLFQTARRFNMEVQPQLVLLQKTLLNIEGLGRQLYPDLDLWNTAQPYLEKWMKQRIAPPGVWKNVKQHLPEWLEQSPEVPKLIFDAMNQIKHLDSFTQKREQQTIQLKNDINLQRKQTKDYMIGGTLLVLAIALSKPDTQQWLTNLTWSEIGPAIVGAYFIFRTKRITK